MSIDREKNYLADVELHGYIMAQLYQSFAAWVEKKRHFGAKVSMRSGHPIMHAAQWLGKRGHANADEWNEMWVNKASLNYLYMCDENVEKYIPQERLNETFTLVDNGYAGTITNTLTSKFGNKDLQTLLMLGDKPFCESKSFRKTSKRDALFGRRDVQAAHGRDAFQMLHDIVEAMPQKYEPFDKTNFKKDSDGQVEVQLKKLNTFDASAFGAYRTGMEKGFEDCFDAVKSGDKTQFSNYIKALLGAVPSAKSVLKEYKPTALLDVCGRLPKHRAEFAQHGERIQEVYHGVARH